MKNLARLSLLLMIGLLSACSRAPSDADVQKAVETRYVQMGLGELFLVENLQRLNGYPDEQAYVVEARYDLRFLMSVEDYLVQQQQAAEARAGNDQLPFGRVLDSLKLGMMGAMFGNPQAGDVIQREERLRLVKSERGWIAPRQ